MELTDFENVQRLRSERQGLKKRVQLFSDAANGRCSSVRAFLGDDQPIAVLLNEAEGAAVFALLNSALQNQLTENTAKLAALGVTVESDS